MNSKTDDILQENEERITRYLHGEMNPDEEILFEKDIQSDEILRNQTEAIARTIKAMNAIGSEHDRKLVEEMRGSSKKKTRPTRWLSIAASIAIVFTFGFKIFDYIRIGNIGEEYATLFPASEIFKGDENSEMTILLTGLFSNVAEGKDLDNTIATLSPIWANYYKSVNIYDIARFDNGNYKEETIPYEHYVGWYLTIAYLRNHDKRRAKVILGQMRSIYREEVSIMGSNLFELSLKIRYLM